MDSTNKTNYFIKNNISVVNHLNKRFYLYNEYRDWSYTDSSSPIRLKHYPKKREVEYDFADNEFDHLLVCITNRCNIVCDYCFRGFNMNKVKEISTSDIINTADFFLKKSKKKPTFQFTGGEVFVRKDIEDIFEYLHSKNFRIWMTTNGVSPLIHKSDRIKKIFENNPKVHVRVSLDGHTAELFEKHRGGPGTFKKVEENLKYLVSINVPTSVKMVITPDNFDYIEETLEWAYNLGLSGWNYNVLRYTGAMAETPPADSTAKAKAKIPYVGYTEVGRKLNDILNRKKYLAPLLGISRYGKILDTFYGNKIHGVHMIYYVLNFNGDVYLNDNLLDSRHKQGNIHIDDMNAFKGLEEYRQQFDFELECCKKCPISGFCFQKGDYGELVQKGANLDSEFPNCNDIRNHYFDMLSLGDEGTQILEHMNPLTYGRPLPQ